MSNHHPSNGLAGLRAAAARPWSLRTIAGLALVLGIMVVGRDAFGAGGGGDAHGAAHGSVPSEDHWTIFAQFAPTAVENLRAMWGKTWLQGEPMPSRTMHVLIGIVVFIFALTVSSIAAKKFSRQGDDAILPERTFGWFTVFDLAGEWIYKTMVDSMGKKQARFFFPLIFSLGTYILFSNLIGLIPGFSASTDNLNTTVPLALVVFFATHIYGVKEHGFGHYFAHFLGPMRGVAWLPLMILMFAIELVSHFARPASLAIRLMGNMFGDHMVLGVFLSFGLLLVPLPIMVLGTLVCVVQTLVFCLLSIVYIALAVEHAEGNDAAH